MSSISAIWPQTSLSTNLNAPLVGGKRFVAGHAPASSVSAIEAMPFLAVFDVTALGELTGMDAGFQDQVMFDFITWSDELVADLRHAVATREPESAGRAASLLGTASSTVGACRLAALCAGIARLCHLGELDQVARHVPGLQREVGAVHAQIGALVRESAPAALIPV